MDIILSNASGKPIYEQIADQVKEQIMSGALSAGDALPSMRLLAKELRISVITTKRAYEELERDGFLENVPGKGCFVAPQNRELLREAQLRKVEEKLSQAVEEARKGAFPLEELHEMLDILYKGEEL
ncbi:GntR family transcriptional regulator [Oscillospiraceae bacterium 44-34]|jgi:GntR family transcriptional regulator|nr:GntR family transcriptional regulator [Lawsonibacter sp.]